MRAVNPRTLIRRCAPPRVNTQCWRSPASGRKGAARPARSCGDKAALQRRHEGAPLRLAHTAPTGDLVGRAPAPDAKARSRIDDADLDAGGGRRVRGGFKAHAPYLGGGVADEKADAEAISAIVVPSCGVLSREGIEGEHWSPNHPQGTIYAHFILASLAALGRQNLNLDEV